MLRVGGHLAQLASPAELLSTPADPFVAGFVGRDRGYRALGFVVAGQLPVSEEPFVALGSDLSHAKDQAQDGWVLVVDDKKAPQGWLAMGGVPDSGLTGQVGPESLNLGGTLAREGGTLRQALDAALSSPSGRGVVVDGDGSLRGTVTAAEVITVIDAQAHNGAPR